MRIALHLIFLLTIPIIDAATTKIAVCEGAGCPNTSLSQGRILVSAVPTFLWYLWPFLAGLFLADLYVSMRYLALLCYTDFCI